MGAGGQLLEIAVAAVLEVTARGRLADGDIVGGGEIVAANGGGANTGHADGSRGSGRGCRIAGGCRRCGADITGRTVGVMGGAVGGGGADGSERMGSPSPGVGGRLSGVGARQ